MLGQAGRACGLNTAPSSLEGFPKVEGKGRSGVAALQEEGDLNSSRKVCLFYPDWMWYHQESDLGEPQE